MTKYFIMEFSLLIPNAQIHWTYKFCAIPLTYTEMASRNTK